jgi:hypothetical protein
VLKNGDTHIKEGKVIQKGDKTIEEIVLRRGTPGVVVFMPKSDRLGVCFDPNDNNKYLMFYQVQKIEIAIAFWQKNGIENPEL